MKKQLLGTTTLVAAGLLMGQGAFAAEPMSLSIGGYLQSAFSVADDDDGVGRPGAGIHPNTISTEGEVQFTATTELDNGLMIRARIEYEAVNQSGGAAIVDERYVRFSGGFGQFVIGQDDNASYQMQYTAPQGSWQMGINSPTFALPATGGNAITSYTSLWGGPGGDGGKIIYFTPRFNGFQLGVSYQPDGAGDPGAFPSTRTSDSDFAGQETIIAVGVNYVSSFDEVDVAVNFGYVHGQLEQNGGTTTTSVSVTSGGSVVGSFTTTPGGGRANQEVFVAGVNVGFEGFTVGAGYMHDNRGRSGRQDFQGFDIGVTYSTGPWTVGVSYLDIEIERGAGAGEDDVNAWLLAGQYSLGGGVDLFGGVKWYDFDDSANAVGSENSVIIGVLGTSIYF